MSHFRLHDDIFSPVRCDSSTINESNDSLEESSNEPLNFGEFSLTDAFKDKIAIAKSILESPQENDLKSKNGNITKVESTNSSKPIVNKNLSGKSMAKRHSSKLKLEEVKSHKTLAVRKESTESQQNEQGSLCKEDIIDSSCLKSDACDKLHKKKVKSASSSKSETTNQDLQKYSRKDNKSSKHNSVNKEQKSSSELLMEGNMTNNTSTSLQSNDIKFKDSSAMPAEFRKNISKSHMDENKSNSNSISLQAEELNINPLQTSYEATIKMMIQNSISTESAKIRQLMYMQQMSFYREMNKIKDNMEKHHFEITERLFKVIEELMQMNVTLKTGLSNKN